MRPIEAGYELNGDTFYVCRGYHEGHLITGKFRPHPDKDQCWLAFDGAEKEYNEKFEVLTNPNGNKLSLAWKSYRKIHIFSKF